MKKEDEFDSKCGEQDESDDDPINNFFRGKPVNAKKIKIPTSSFTTTSATIVKKEPKVRLIDDTKKIKVEEASRMKTEFLNTRVELIDCTLGIDEKKEIVNIPPELQIYTRYEFNLPFQQLPILKQQKNIIDSIRKNRVTVLKAFTGTGKSSQVPQYILEEAYKRREKCNIIVTQPRRISTLSLASRVALERKCEVGSLVGYQISKDKKLDNEDTRILYCTTGVFLQKLVNQKSLKNWSHIIIDEIHERDVEMDLVLLIIKRLMIATSSKAKIILMSATLNVDKISTYFELVHTVPVLDLNVSRKFNVTVEYLEKLDHIGAKREYIDLENPGICNEMYKLGADLIELVKYKGASTFLVFLPGLYEIECFERELKKKREHLDINDFHLFILHSSIPLENMHDLFDTNIEKKIILATNVAETSLTIPDIQIVIDYCLSKYLEAESNLTQLKLSWASKMNLEQRAGRTGRTSKGQVIRMLFKDQYDKLQIEPKPEMQRMSLEKVILTVKKLNMGNPSEIIAISLDPPKRSSIVKAILSLKENYAISRYTNEQFDFLNGNLTFIGEVMTKLPIDIRLSKLIMFGYIFSAIDDCIIIAAGLSVRSIFRSSIQNRMNAFEIKLSYDSTSDCIAILNIYKRYRSWCKENESRLSFGLKNDWCKLYMIDYKNFMEMQKQIDDIRNRLHEYNLLGDKFRYTYNEKMFVIKLCIAGAFYPNLYIFGGKIPDRDDFRLLNNKNPCSTVYFSGYKNSKNGKLYEKQIRDLLFESEVINCVDDATVMFDSNSQRVCVEFDNIRNDSEIKMPGDVKLEVYKAIKMRNLNRNEQSIKTMSYENEEMYAPRDENEESNSSSNKELRIKDKLNIYPNRTLLNEEAAQYLFGKITNVISPGKFYFQPNKGKELLEKHKRAIAFGLEKIKSLDEILDNNKIIVLHNKEFERAQIIDGPDGNSIYKVRLIDFGKVVEVNESNFYTCIGLTKEDRQQLLSEILARPPSCFECKLAKIQPNALYQNGWNKQSIVHFEKLILDKEVEIEIYAFNHYDKIASVEIILRNENQLRVSKDLLHKHFAKQCNESYTTMFNKISTDNMQFMKYDIHKERTKVELPQELLVERVKLDGPHSSLEINSYEKTYRSFEHSLIRIDSLSVNSVLIDPYAFDGVKKVLIAASKSENNGIISLRQTTLMPHLTGMASIIGLIFSPFAQIRYDKNRTRFTSILTGLGCDFSEMPYYDEHDCLFKTDVELDNQDFDMLNQLRSEMSLLMQGSYRDNEIRSRACSLLLKIIKKDRIQIPQSREENDCEYMWNDSMIEGYPMNEQMFSEHKVKKLKPISTDLIKRINNNLKTLEQMAQISKRDEEVFCIACDERIMKSIELKTHVLTNKHKMLKDKYQNYSNNNDVNYKRK